MSLMTTMETGCSGSPRQPLPTLRKREGASLGLRERYAGIAPERFATARFLFQRNDSSQALSRRKGGMQPGNRGTRVCLGLDEDRADAVV